jgi:hypothetical protein
MAANTVEPPPAGTAESTRGDLETARARVEMLQARIAILQADINTTTGLLAERRFSGRRKAKRDLRDAKAVLTIAAQALDLLKIEADLVRLATPGAEEISLRDWESPIADLPRTAVLEGKRQAMQRKLQSLYPNLFDSLDWSA